MPLVTDSGEREGLAHPGTVAPLPVAAAIDPLDQSLEDSTLKHPGRRFQLLYVSEFTGFTPSTLPP